MAMDIVDRLRCILKGNRVAQDAADEIIRLRAALTELERACEHRASLLPRDVYVITEAVEVTVMDDTTNVKGNGQAAPQIGEGANDGNN